MIHIKDWDREETDYNGKAQPKVYYAVVNGKEKAVGKADLIKMIEMTLPERAEREEATTDDAANGRQHETARGL